MHRHKYVCLIQLYKVGQKALNCPSPPCITCWKQQHSLGIQPSMAGSAQCRNPSNSWIPQKGQLFKA